LHKIKRNDYISIMEEEQKKLIFQKAGDYLLDISKLVFGGVILAGVVKISVNYYVLFGIGAAAVVTTAILGFGLITLSNKQ